MHRDQERMQKDPGFGGKPGKEGYLHWVQTPMPAEYSLVEAP